jgi:hypothetical protein
MSAPRPVKKEAFDSYMKRLNKYLAERIKMLRGRKKQGRRPAA